jgi:threonine dehydrogenase-like Zn-dependent dehydrogenase
MVSIVFTNSLLKAATIPLAAMTAAVGLYMRLSKYWSCKIFIPRSYTDLPTTDLPEPWRPTTVPTPLIIYAASGAVGAFAMKMAKASNIHPLIAVAGKGAEYVETLIDRSKGDAIVDYRQGDDAVVSGIRDALKKAGVKEVKYAFDCVCDHNSYQNICRVLSETGSQITLVRPALSYEDIPNNISWTKTTVGSVHRKPADLTAGVPGITTGHKDFGYIFFRLFGRGLQDGWFTPHPYEVIPGGLNGVEEGLIRLKAGKASAIKYVYKL